MASENDSAESGTSSPAASTSQVSRAARRGASENLRCPICRAAINDRASGSWRQHPFCFYCMVEWFHNRVEGLSPFLHTFRMVGDSNSEVHSIGESITSASHTQGERAGSRSAERFQHRSSGRQCCKSCSRSCGGSHGGSRGGSRGRAQEKSRSRYPRRHHNGRTRVQQAQGYNHSSSRRQQQSRTQNTARDKGQASRTKRRVRALSRRRKRRQQYQVSFIEPRAIRSRSRQRSRSSASQTLREYLRKMERDEGRALSCAFQQKSPDMIVKDPATRETKSPHDQVTWGHGYAYVSTPPDLKWVTAEWVKPFIPKTTKPPAEAPQVASASWTRRKHRTFF
ncbi:hypothetical protein DUI87_10988 [Hirundo rustica rustica]|uniref:Uncharacterized protein n=1 Tax=Hirundo rustica rustica TaxID=333673 RepID=A0A3M0KRU7_HIRRU|nr:hypothetical protein DUI87_10988 [Hirundo rustica rustica]